jgi:hypothetical protein
MNRYLLLIMGLMINSLITTYALTEAEKDEFERNETAQVTLWNINLESSQGKPDEVKISELWLGLRNMGYRKSYPGHSIAVDDIYKKLQSELLSIPGHAEYAREEIEKARLSLGALIYEVGYERTRARQFETLSQLPSPESVKVLGDYLDDDRDLAEEPVWFPDGGVAGLDPNSLLAVKTLNSIGLRDADFPPPDVGERPSLEDYAVRDKAWRDIWHYEYDKRRKELDPWRAWYVEVKSGQRTFSFKGQSVEYRFKPDGTWETIPIANPPDDAPEVPESSPADRRPVAQVTKEQPPGNADKTFSPYIFAALAALLALAAAWFGLRRTKAGR